MMDFLAQHRIKGLRSWMRAAVVTVVVVALTVAAALAPAVSFGAKTPPPSVSSVSPDGGPTSGGTSVTINGAYLTGATEVKFGSIAAATFTAKSGTKIRATSPAAEMGVVDVTVTTPAGTSETSPADEFVYGPNVTAVSPDRGPESGGTSVTVTGSDLRGATGVKFGSVNATSFEVNSQSSITAVSPEGTGTVDVTVISPQGTSAVGSADQFSYVPAPTVSSVSPSGGPEAGGTEVIITGTNLNEATAVDFGMSPASFFINNESSITAFSPAGMGVVDVTVTTAFGGTSLTSFVDEFAYVPPPTVTEVSPATGPASGGSSVTITGNNLSGATAVDFGSSSATGFVIDSESSITAVSPPGHPGETVDVTVTTLGGTSATSPADSFRYLQSEPLRVTQIAPGSGAFIGGTPVIIMGDGFVGATAVDFGSASATSFTVDSQHKISAVVPPGTGTVDVTVTTPEGVSPKSPADLFEYVTLSPTVEKVAPAYAHIGKYPVVIKGKNFYGATAVDFGSGNAASFRVVSGRVIDAVAPSPIAATVDVTVTTPEGTSAIGPGDRFTYKLEAPVITAAVSPHLGPAAGGTSVTIHGEYFVEVSAVDFGSVDAASFIVNSPTSITATSPPATVGPVEINVVTPLSGTVPPRCTRHPSLQCHLCKRPHILCDHYARFRFVELTITNVVPSTGPTTGGTAVTITGTGFGVGTNATEFHFGSVPAASVQCTSVTTCTVVAPEQKAGTVNVRAKIVGQRLAPSKRNPPSDQFTYE
jgi:hypothetical protein